MISIPFLTKKEEKSEGYVLMLFLAGDKVHGFAFEEADMNNRTALYTAHIDPFLDDAIDKIEKIIFDCEKDLGKDIYLVNTALLLNSLYINDAGSVRDDFIQKIKKIFKTLDLNNLGYINFCEAVTFGLNKKNFTFVEETIYDFIIYEIVNNTVKNTKKIAKTQNESDSTSELHKALAEYDEIVYFIGSNEFRKNTTLKGDFIETDQLREIFIEIYKKNKCDDNQDNVTITDENNKTIKENTETNESNNDSVFAALPVMPGFSAEASQDLKSTYAFEETNVTKTNINLVGNLKKFISRIKFPSIALFSKKPANILLLLPVLILIIPVYLLLFHRSDITITTKKENFSSETNFVVSKDKNYVGIFTDSVDVKVSANTTGEKEVGEKAEGEISLYNGTFKAQEIVQDTRLTTGNGVTFIITETTTIPAATTSANLDEGVVTKSFGKKNSKVKALAIGADGNIDDGVKLTIAELDEDEIYALAVANFKGGYKKTVSVFSDEDKADLEEKAEAQAKKKLLQLFADKNGTDSILLTDTFEINEGSRKYSVDEGEEADRADISIQGKATALYIEKAELEKKVQNEELKEKQFVDGTFQLTDIKLASNKPGTYNYRAIVNGKVQNFIDKDELKQKISGKFKGTASDLLKEERNIINFDIKTKPISLPIIPFNSKFINFIFER